MSLGEFDGGHLAVLGDTNESVTEKTGEVRLHLLDSVLLDLNHILQTLGEDDRLRLLFISETYMTKLTEVVAFCSYN